MSGFPQKFYHAVFWPIRILMGFAHPIVHVRGLENIPDGPAVICCNHSSFSDAIWVIVCSHQKRIFRTMAKKELFSHRVLGWFITKLGAFPVDREANDIHAVKTALGVLREGDKIPCIPLRKYNRNRKWHPSSVSALSGTETNGWDRVYKSFHEFCTLLLAS